MQIGPTVLDVGRLVRYERRCRHWSQAELGARSRTSRSFVSDFETGKPTVEFGRVLAVLASLELELTIADHDGGSSSSTPDHVDLDVLLDSYREPR